jgi:hypothetical protein
VTLGANMAVTSLCPSNDVTFTADPGAASFANYEFFVDGVSVQSGSSDFYLAQNLADGQVIGLTATANNGCVSLSNEISVTVNAIDGLWMGAVDSDWNNGANWCNGTYPAGVIIEISENCINDPIIEDEVSFAGFTIGSNVTVTLEPGASLDVSTSFVNNGEIILRSIPDSVSALNVPEGNTNSGQGRIELALKANQWYRLGQPIQNPTGAIYDASDLDDSWIYRSETSWKRITSDDTPLDPMQGTMTLYKSDHQLSYTGTLNTGEVSFNITYGMGYYLMANPYPGSMKWDTGLLSEGISLSDNVSHTIYYRVYAGSQVGDFMITFNGYTGISTILDGTVFPGDNMVDNIGNISPLQSVWVKVNSSEAATITVDNRARINDNSMPLKSGSLGISTRNMVRIYQQNQYVSDAAVIYFDDAFSEGLENSDSEKMFNNSKQVPEVYTRTGSASLAINGLPELTGEEQSIPLSVRNQTDGPVTFSVNLDEFNDAFTLFLEDTQAETWTNLRETPEYVYTPTQLGDVHDRFVLHIQKVTTAIVDPQQIGAGAVDGITITGHETYARVTIPNTLLQQNHGDALIEVVNMNGRVLNQVTSNQEVTTVDLPRSSGVYVVRVQAGKTGKSEKVVVQKQ